MTPQRMVDIQNVIKESVKRTGVNGLIDLRATYYSPKAVEFDGTLEELQQACVALGMKKEANFRYRA